MAHELTESGANARGRIARRLLPFLFLLYVANYLDRTNIAYATLGMKGDLGLTDSVFGTASGIFFVGYLLLQIPGALLAERWGARRLLATTLITWGLLTVLTGFVRTPVELYGARFLLGAAEAAFFPGVIVYLSNWFVDEDRGKAIARFMSAIPVAAIIGGPIAGAILSIDRAGIPGWRWLFLLEGIPAVLLGITAFFVLPDRPDQARWLPIAERDWLHARLAEGGVSTTRRERKPMHHVIRDGSILLLGVGLFFSYIGGYAFVFWMPTMLRRLTGWTDLQRIGWVGAVPFVAGLIGMLLFGWNSDRTRERRWHFAVPQFTAAAALIAWLLLPPSDTLLIAVFTLVGFGTTAHLPAFWTLPASLLGRFTVAAAIGFISCVASVGGFVGPKVVGELTQRSGSFAYAFVFMAACCTIGGVVVLLCPQQRRA